MKNDSSYMMPKHTLHYLAGLTLVLSLSGCSEEPFGSTDGGVGGALNAASGQGGSTQITGTGGASAIDNPTTGGFSGATTDGTLQLSTGGTTQLGTGGAAQASTGGAADVSTGGAAQASTGGAANVSTGGAAQASTGGAADVSTGGAAQASTGGAADVNTGGAADVSTGGAAQASTGGTSQLGAGGTAQASTGGAAQVSTGGATQVISSSPDEPLCVDGNGADVPYDFSIGLMGEYAYELSMSCEVGGYLMPLLMADPEQLTEVNAFVATATDWYRADILNCNGATTQLDQNSYGLLPVSQSADLSDADVDASLALFSMVLDRHDGLADAVSADKKGKIKNRINSVKQRAVHGSAAGLTKTLTPPDCMPAAGG